MSHGNRPIWMGITKPASITPPKENELKETEIIQKILEELNDFPTQEENMKREQVLGKLDRILNDFVVATAKAQSFGSLAVDCRCQLVTSGSFKLGVHGPGADIDTICILPNFIKPHHFFEDLPNVLNQCPEVRDLTCVSEATVPLIKLIFDEVELDLLYAPINMQIIPKNLNVLDMNLLRGIDQRTARALNGPRVAQETLDLVYRKDTYRLSLRFIRQWAKRRGIYGNVHGYLGGVHCSLLVARICQFFPYSSASRIVRQFFTVYGSLWKWPQPVLLKKMEKRDDLNLDVWDPNNRRNRFHILPIITPAYPSQNTTHNVHPATKRVIMEEFQRGEKLLPSDSEEIHTIDTFRRILEETDFFIRYKTFLRVDVMATTPEDLGIWKGFVESKFRFLASNLQRLIGENMLVHVFPKAIKKPREEKQEKEKMKDEDEDEEEETETETKKKKSEEGEKQEKEKKGEEEEVEGEGEKEEEVVEPYCVSLFIGLQFQRERLRVNLMSAIAKFHSIVNSWDSKTDEMLPCSIVRVKRSEIPDWVLSKEKKKLFIRRRKRDRSEEKKRKREEFEAQQKELAESSSTEQGDPGLPGLGQGMNESAANQLKNENKEIEKLQPPVKKRKLQEGEEEEIRKSDQETQPQQQQETTEGDNAAAPPQQVVRPPPPPTPSSASGNDGEEKEDEEDDDGIISSNVRGYKERIIEDDEDEDTMFPRNSNNTPATPRDEDDTDSSFNIAPKFHF